jgi:hypothetical protein
MSSPLDQVHARFYCPSFTKGDARIERALSAVEALVGRRLTHYFQTSRGKTKEIPGDRTEFVSRWLPGQNEKFGSQLLCSESVYDGLLLVSLDNILTLPQLAGRRGEPFNGAIQITLARDDAWMRRASRGVAGLIAAGDCFHGFVRTPPLSSQQFHTRQRLAQQEQEVEKLRAQSESLAEASRKLLAAQRDRFIYDLAAQPLIGVTPDGRSFASDLYWLNYWNEATAARYGFPNDSLDSPLQGLHEKLPGGWLVRLTKEPADLDKPADLERFRWAYQRFASPPSQ